MLGWNVASQHCPWCKPAFENEAREASFKKRDPPRDTERLAQRNLGSCSLPEPPTKWFLYTKRLTLALIQKGVRVVKKYTSQLEHWGFTHTQKRGRFDSNEERKRTYTHRNPSQSATGSLLKASRLKLSEYSKTQGIQNNCQQTKEVKIQRL